MRSALIESGVVINVIVGTLPGFVECPDDVSPGWTYDGETWAAPSSPEPAPELVGFVSRRQILTGLAFAGWISEDEAAAALATGAMPAAVDSVIAQLPEGERFAARMKWIGFQNAYRDDPMVAALAAIEGKTEQEVDDFFVLCAAIE